jgi:hypothetical protein
LLLIFRGVDAGAVGRASRRALAWSGGFLALAVLTNQKLLLAGPTLAATAAWYAWDDGWGGARRERLANVASQVAGFLIPSVILVAAFALTGGLPGLVRNALFGGLAWKAEMSASTILAFLAKYDPWLMALAAGGAVTLIIGAVRRDGRWRLNALFVLNAAGVFGGLFLIPVPFSQYCLIFVPLFAILAAVLLARVANTPWHDDVRPQPLGSTGVALVAIVTGAIALVDLRIARPVVLHPSLYPVIVVGGLVALLTLARRRRPFDALAIVAIALCVYPAQWSWWTLGETSPVQTAGLRYVMSSTAPDAVVLDGWSGYGVFRPHAWYYWMLHPGVRAMLPASAGATLTDLVGTDAIHPDLIVLDSSLEAFDPDLEALVRSRYRYSGQPKIWVR